MSNLGFQSLFHRLSLFHGLQVHRYFIERNGTLYSPDSSGKTDNALKAYDAVFFSISFELDYLHMLGMLQSCGIALEAEKRLNRGPLIIVGGVAVTANPAVLSPIADILYIGDMDYGLDDLLSLLLEHGFNIENAAQEELSHIGGVYIPSVHGQVKGGRLPVQKATTENILDPAHTVVLTGSTEFSNMFLIEIGRGCRNSCGFCMTRCVHRPLRTVPQQVLVEKTELATGLTKRVGLIAPVLTDHEDLATIVGKLNEMNMTVSFSSLRADDFDDTVAGLLKKNGQSTVTFAPETGSEELRKRIGKNLKDDALIHAVSIAQRHGIRRIRYYFIIGLPGESTHDMEMLVELVKRTVQQFSHRGAQLALSINPFVPKKGTPMQHYPLNSLDYYNSVRSYILGELNEIKEVRIRFESLKKLSVHYYLSVGDHRIGTLLAASLERGTMKEFSGSAAAIMGF